MDSFYGPYSGYQNSHKTDVWNKDSDVRNIDNDVRNMDNDVRDMDNDIQNSEKIPVLIPDIKSLMSRIWTVKTGPIPDINLRCPE